MSELRDYQNSSAIREVIGCLLKDPTLLVNHKITKEDFVEAFHKLLFVTINNLFVQGVSKIDAFDTKCQFKLLIFGENCSSLINDCLYCFKISNSDSFSFTVFLFIAIYR